MALLLLLLFGETDPSQVTAKLHHISVTSCAVIEITNLAMIGNDYRCKCNFLNIVTTNTFEIYYDVQL
jgi:hypothetical protein